MCPLVTLRTPVTPTTLPTTPMTPITRMATLTTTTPNKDTLGIYIYLNTCYTNQRLLIARKLCDTCTLDLIFHKYYFNKAMQSNHPVT